MAPKQQTLKLYQLFSHSKTSNPIPISPKSLKSPLSPPPPPESPDLPNWLVNNETLEIPNQNDDDFVVPSVADWVERHRAGKINPISNGSPIEPKISKIDELSKILKKHRSSTDSVVEALNGCGIDATNALILQVLKRFSNDWVPAFGVFSWAKRRTGYVHKREVFDVMVDILGKHRKFDLMWGLVKEMADLEDYVTMATMSKVIRRLAAAGMHKDAIDAFRGLENFGLEKDKEALGIVMDALVKGGSVELAYSVFMEFKDSIPVDLQSYNILIHGYCKAGKLDDAKKTMVEMEKNGIQPNVIAYTSLIESYCKSKDFRSVDSLLVEMEEKGIKPNVITYTIMMHGLGKAKQINEALEVYDKMKRNRLAPDAAFYSSLIFILGTSGRVKDAWNVFEDMEKQGVSRTVMAYNTMIACACANSQEEAALELLRRMERDSCEPGLKTYAPLLKMCCKKKRIKVLKFLLDHMHKNNVSIDLGTYAILVRGLCSSGKLELACSFFEEAVSKGMVPYTGCARYWWRNSGKITWWNLWTGFRNSQYRQNRENRDEFWRSVVVILSCGMKIKLKFVSY